MEMDGPSRNLNKANFSSEKKGKRCAAFGCSKTFYGPNGGKIFAQPHTTLCIQFLDRENNGIVIGKTDLFYNSMGMCGNFYPNGLPTSLHLFKFMYVSMYFCLVFNVLYLYILCEL